MLNADNGTYDSWYWAHPPVYMPLNCNMAEVTRLKEVVEIPVVCAGRMQPDEASASISEGKLDAMGIQHTCFFEVAPDPTLQCAEKGVDQMRAFEPDTIMLLAVDLPWTQQRLCG